MPPLADLFGVCVLPETYTLAPGSGCFSIVRISGSTVDTVHSFVVGGFWLLLHTFQCEGGPRILRSILGQTKSMPVAIPQVQFLVKVICPLLSCLMLLVRQCRYLWIFQQLLFAVFLRPFASGRHLFGRSPVENKIMDFSGR